MSSLDHILIGRYCGKSHAEVAEADEAGLLTEDEDDEVLGKVYFLRTRLSGRRLLRAWTAWRA